jgi:hypothetical protein
MRQATGGQVGTDWPLVWWRAFWVGAWLLLVYTILAGVLWEFEPPPGPVILLITVLVWTAGGILWRVWARERRRTRALARLSRELEMAFAPVVPEATLARLSHFPLFSRGTERRGKNGMEGERNGVGLLVMDYTYAFAAEVGGDAYAVPYEQTVVVFPERVPNLPDFLLVPRGLFNKTLDQALGMVFGKPGDVDVSGDKDAFRKGYRVDGPDEVALRKLFDEKTRAFFAGNRGWYVEARGGQLLIYKAGVRTNPANLRARIDKSLEIRRAFLPLAA